MSIDYATGSRLNLNDDRAWFPLRSGSSSLAYCPRLDDDPSGPGDGIPWVDRPGTLKIPGTGSPNRPPDAIVAFMNAASFRVNVEISGNGQSASFNEVIDLGMRERRGEEITSAGDPITSLATRWQWAEFGSPPGPPRVPYALTQLRVFNEVGEGQELLIFNPFEISEASSSLVYYSVIEDLWTVYFDFFVGATDGSVTGDRATAEYNPFSTDYSENYSNGFTLMGFECPLRLDEGASVSGSITAESYLTRY
jgi:hypothetical protein